MNKPISKVCDSFEDEPIGFEGLGGELTAVHHLYGICEVTNECLWHVVEFINVLPNSDTFRHNIGIVDEGVRSTGVLNLPTGPLNFPSLREIGTYIKRVTHCRMVGEEDIGVVVQSRGERVHAEVIPFPPSGSWGRESRGPRDGAESMHIM